MLPDIIPLKEDIARRLSEVFRARVNSFLGVVNEMPRSYLKEGNSIVIIREDGSRDETILRQASGEIEISASEVPTMTIQDRIDKMDIVARDMAGQISRHMFDDIGKAIEEVGNVVKSGGRPFDADIFLETLQTMHIEFDDDGNMREITAVFPPKLEPQARETIRQFQTDPELKKRYEDLMTQKRREYRAREAARKLVG